MQKFPNLKNPIHFFATLGGIGLSPLAPGTVGSIFGWIIFIVISHYIGIDMVGALIGLIVVLAIVISGEASKELIEKDHKSIVIDELAGIWLAMYPVFFISTTQYERSLYAILVLIFFRIFDIFKPYPISLIDQNFKNGFGIVFDDLVAGIYAAIFASFITLYLI
jgi:phosphatidylglycerophosphatase A